MSAAGRSGASIFARRPGPTGSARGVPIPANKDARRRFPTWILCPQLRLHEESAKAGRRRGLQPRVAQPLPFRPRKGPRSPAAPCPPGPFPLPERPPTGRRGLPARCSPGPARYLRGAAPLFVERRARDPLPRGRLRPASQRAPACRVQVLCRRRPLRRTSSRRRRRRVRSPAPPHHVPHPRLRHRETRSRPAWVGAQQPVGARRPRDQSAPLRPGPDTTPGRAGPVFSGPRLCCPLAQIRDALGHSRADGAPLNRPRLVR